MPTKPLSLEKMPAGDREGQSTVGAETQEAVAHLFNLIERLEGAVTQPEHNDVDVSPHLRESSLDAGIDQSAGILNNLNVRIAKLEQGLEVAELRAEVRVLCETVSDLRYAAGWGTAANGDRITMMMHNCQEALSSEGRQLSELSSRTEELRKATEDAASDILAVMGQLNQCSRTTDGQIEKLARAMRALRAEIASDTNGMAHEQHSFRQLATETFSELIEDNTSAKKRVEAVAGDLATIRRKIDSQNDYTRHLSERIRRIECAVAAYQERETALAKLHAQLATTLRPETEA